MIPDLKIDSVKDDFDKYLSGKSAERIIFSAPFGSGKTYFLNKFFQNNEKYEAIILRPVNYAVASNEDIFELIKHDILFELLKKTDLKFNELDLDFVLAAKLYSESKFIEILKPFVFAIPGLGKTIKEITKPFEELFNRIKDYKRKVEVDEKSEIISFLREISLEKGSIYESDFTTGTICQLVDQLKRKGKKPKTVLVIDDLDRIDPAHLFRLLNVFAAHFDEDNNSNKFGFDHLVFVCDINNVFRIYESFYGTGVDFAGYINKFYSKEIFEYNNVKVLVDSLDDWLTKIQFVNRPQHRSDIFKDRNIIWRNWLVFLIVRMIQSNKLSLRTVKNQILRPFVYNRYSIAISNKGRNSNEQFSWFFIFDFLKSLFGNDVSGFSSAILNSNFNNSSTDDSLSIGNFDRFVGELLVITDWRNRDSLFLGTRTTSVGALKVEYDIRQDREYIFGQIRNVSNSSDWDPSKIDYDFLIKEAFKVYQETIKTKMRS